MKGTWKNFKDNIIGQKGLLSIGLAWIIVAVLTWESIFLFIMNRTLRAS
jgi:hypothetical protein